MQKIQNLNKSGPAAVESQSQALADENKMLIEQLHLVQEELERLHQANDATVGVLPSGQKLLWVDEEMPDVLAENTRLQTKLEVQAQLYQCESAGSLHNKLGTLLIHSVDRPASLWSLPGKLWGVWRSYHKPPPAALGGKSFGKVVEAWESGGLPAVEALLEKSACSPLIQANAYTALARSLVNKDSHHAAEVSRRAYALDPKPYRLKWLAFRLHEAGELAEAEAMLEALPTDIQISESEAKQIRQIKHEAEYWRKLQAKRQTGYAEKQAKVEATIRQLTEQCAAQGQQLEASQQEITQLKRDQARWQQDADSWQQRFLQQQAALADSQSELAGISQSVLALKQENTQLQEEQNLLLAQVHQLQEAVESHHRQSVVLEQENALLLARCDEHSRSAKALEHERESLLKQLVATELKQAEQLQSGQMALAALQAELDTVQAERAAYASDQARTIDALQQANAALELDKNSQAAQLAVLQTELSAVQAERQAFATQQFDAIEALQQAKAKLEADIAGLAARSDDQSKLLNERNKRISELEVQIQQRQESEAELIVRQQHMQEELVRAEAQLDLIKVMVLKEDGL